MEQAHVIKQMVEFNQNLFNNTFSAVVLLQDRSEEMVKSLLTDNRWIPAEGRKMVEDWAESYKAGRNDFKKYMDDGYKYLTSFLSR